MNNSKEIKENLTIEEINSLLSSLGGDPIIKGNTIISRTICHGGESHKLYYYDNTKLFKCYTDCEDDSFDIFQLIIKNKQVNGIDFSLNQAINYIVDFFNLNIKNNNFNINKEEIEDWKIIDKYEENNNLKEEEEEKKIELTIYDDKILKYLPHPKIIPWLKEGIKQEIMDYAEIAFDPINYGIVIPHRNFNGELIGIRERTLIKEEEKNGKYKPAILNYKMYNHQLGFNLYNLNNSKENIKKIKKVIIGEGEKFCLMYSSYFGKENDITVAVCGSNITKYQMELLINLEVQEVIIAFDKQFKELNDNEFKWWVKKLKSINSKFSNYVKISFMFDKENLLEYKMSPIDNGKDIFLQLFNKRFSI